VVDVRDDGDVAEVRAAEVHVFGLRHKAQLYGSSGSDPASARCATWLG
jgi:hypothetical protein